MKQTFWSMAVVIALWGATGLNASAQTTDTNILDNISTRVTWESWNAPFKPVHVIGNIYYVGPAGISSFLITTKAGDILIDTGFDTTVPLIREHIAKLGFKLSDIKIILNTHAHSDHCGGDAMMKSLTGAKIMLGAPDAALVESGGAADFSPYSLEMKSFPPAQVDRRLKDGDEVTLGGTTLVCHLTPGHTKGAATYTMDVQDQGKTLHVLFFSSASLLSEIQLVNNPKYPNMVTDFRATFAKLRSLPCDVFLAPHAGFFDLAGKAARLEKGESPNPFIDTKGYQSCIDAAGKKFKDRLVKENQENKGIRLGN
jgi:metallo-beta-lactamase class B